LRQPEKLFSAAGSPAAVLTEAEWAIWRCSSGSHGTAYCYHSTWEEYVERALIICTSFVRDAVRLQLSRSRPLRCPHCSRVDYGELMATLCMQC